VAGDAPRGEGVVSVVLWDTRHPLDPGFERDWNARLALTPHANFMMDLACLAWDAAQGRHAVAAMIDADGRRAAMVLRREGRGLVCGQPWRWQVVFEGRSAERPIGIEPSDAGWAVEQARRIAAPLPVRCYLPVAPDDGQPAFASYTTILMSIAHDDAALLAAMHPSKRRMIKRAEREGYTVTETPDQLRAFAALSVEASTQRGRAPEYDAAATPEPGQGWREWEQPWMWLLLASRDGRVASGLGDGMRPGGMLDGRKAASSPDARKHGAFALLCLEEARRGRDRGHRWINLGGNTVFKQEMSGTLGQPVVMHCWLAGGAAWGLPDHAEALWRRARARAEGVARRVRDRRAAGGAS
jgi:hypothetical protein